MQSKRTKLHYRCRPQKMGKGKLCDAGIRAQRINKVHNRKHHEGNSSQHNESPKGIPLECLRCSANNYAMQRGVGGMGEAHLNIKEKVVFPTKTWPPVRWQARKPQTQTQHTRLGDKNMDPGH